MEELVKTITEKMEEFKTNAERNLNGSKMAGAKARKASNELTKLFKEYRKVTIEASKN